MKNFVVILLFSRNYDKILLVKRNKEPFKDCWNGIGGKIKDGETLVEAAIRECMEETHIVLQNPKLFITYHYPQSNSINSGTILNVFYDFVDEALIDDNYEGHYEWKDVAFAMDFNNKEIAGFANLAQFIKEIFDAEGIKKFY